MKVFELFAGYGGASFALKKARIAHEVVGYSEIDKYAIQCYDQNHYTQDERLVGMGGRKIHRNYGDCTKIQPSELPDFDLLTAGFPCQAFSVAGKGLGELDTRGTLFNEIIRIAEVKQPRWMLLENVKGLTNKTHRATFEKILSELARIGYLVKWKVLNSKKYGTPQNRERVFFACFRQQSDYDAFLWPLETPLILYLKDILEPDVDEKYYLSDEQTKKLLASARHTSALQTNATANTLAARDYKDPKCIQLNDPLFSQQRVYSPEGVSPTITAGNLGGGKSPCKIIQMNNPAHSNDRVYDAEGVSPTLNTMGGGNRQPFVLSKGVSIQSRIRKLTPRECFRLMGFFADEIDVSGLSNTQQYKIAGNGWDIHLVAQILPLLLRK